MELPIKCDPMQSKVWYLAGCTALKRTGDQPLQARGREGRVVSVKSQTLQEPQNNSGQKAWIKKNNF